MSRPVKERSFYHLHETCRGPITKITLHHVEHPANVFRCSLQYQYTHASGDVCSSGFNSTLVLWNLGSLVSEFRELIRLGVGYTCPRRPRRLRFFE